MTLLQGFQRYLQSEEYSENTIYNYMLAIQGYFRWFMGSYDKEPTVLYAPNVREFLQYLQTVQGRSGKTLNAKVAALQEYNKFLLAEGVQTEMVVGKAQRKRIQQKFASPAQFDAKEVAKFCQAIVEKGNLRNYALVTLLANTGLRITEAINIMLDRDMFLQSYEIVVRNGKGDKERTVLINQKTVTAIRDYLKVRKKHKYASSPYLFVSNKGLKMSRFTAYDIFVEASADAGLHDTLSPHQLRHYFCSMALESGGLDVHELASLAGHSNIHTTLLYTHPTRKKILEKLNRLGS